jgi:hypothetical protein
MKRFICYFLGAVAFLSVNQAHAQACAESSHTYKNCTYNAPALKDGERQTLTNINEGLFSGTVTARCLGGEVRYSAESCVPKQAGACGVQSATWRSVDKKQTCSHETKEMVILNGGNATVYDTENHGKIDYRCDESVLKATSFYCPSGTSPAPAKMDAKVSTQSATMETSSTGYTVTLYTDNNIGAHSATAQNLAQQECMRVSSLFEPDAMPTVITKSYRSQGTGYTFDARCTVSTMVDSCSSGLEAFNLPGQMSPMTGEHTIAPSRDRINQSCVARGYSSVKEIHSIERTYINVVDDFMVLATCQGKASSCGAQEVPDLLFNARIAQATSCTEARATGGLLRVSRGEVPSLAKLKTDICQALSFNNIRSVVSTTLEDQTGAYDYYQATVNCSEYQDDGSNPLLDSCGLSTGGAGSGGGVIGDGVINVTKLSCDRALVSGEMSGKYSQTKGKFVAPPSASDVLEAFCIPNDYAVLDSIDSLEMRFEEEGEYGVIAACSSYQGTDKAQCSDDSGCYGPEVSADSSEVKICDHTGKCYQNACAVVKTPSSALCVGCSAGSWEFDANGNTCAVDVPSVPSGGGSGEIDFFTDTHSGTVEFGCQSGERTLHQGTCFKNCSGGQAVQWADARGDNNCGQIVPAGTYRHGETVTLGTSLEHTGNSKVECDDGQWKVVSGSCLLDCQGSFAWGSGVANNGQSKNGACSASLSRVAHGRSVSASSSAFLTTGSATANCNDGQYRLGVDFIELEPDPRFGEPELIFIPEDSTCNIGCPGSSYTWSMCSSGAPNLFHNGSANLSHSGSSSYRFDSFTNGSATLSCDDGLATLGSKVCNYVISQTVAYGSWNTYRTQCTSYSPSTDSYPGGVSFTQSRDCTPKQRRTVRDKYTWASGAVTYGSSTYAYRDRATYTQSRPAIGTAPPVPVSSSSSDGPITDYGSPSCTSYSPSRSGYYTDESFTQTRDCTQPRRYTTTTITTMSDGTRLYEHTSNIASSRSYVQSRTVSGTMVRETPEVLRWTSTGRTGCPTSPEIGRLIIDMAGTECSVKNQTIWVSEGEPCWGSGYMGWQLRCE